MFWGGAWNRARARSRLATATISLRDDASTALRMASLMAAVERSPQRSLSVGISNPPNLASDRPPKAGVGNLVQSRRDQEQSNKEDDQDRDRRNPPPPHSLQNRYVVKPPANMHASAQQITMPEAHTTPTHHRLK